MKLSWMKIFFVFLFVASAHGAFANWSLDEMMSSRDKKRTGVAKLSSRQKKSLQAWIQKNFVLKGQQNDQEQPQPVTMPHVSEVMQNGKYVKLSDNTVWEIHPADRSTVESWITPANIEVSTGKNQTYPYTLKNMTTKTTVLAKKVAPLMDGSVETNVYSTPSA